MQCSTTKTNTDLCLPLPKTRSCRDKHSRSKQLLDCSRAELPLCTNSQFHHGPCSAGRWKKQAMPKPHAHGSLRENSCMSITCCTSTREGCSPCNILGAPKGHDPQSPKLLFTSPAATCSIQKQTRQDEAGRWLSVLWAYAH